MSKLLKGAVLMLVTVVWGAVAYAGPDRPNRGKELYTPPWDEDLVNLAACKDLPNAECTMLRRLVRMPHAYWLGLNTNVDQELQDLHHILRDAIREKRVPTLVLYSFPQRDCGGGIPLGKRITDEDYRRWVAKLANAVLYYNMEVNIIIEPGGLAHVVTDIDTLCSRRKKSQILTERIELIRFTIWNLALQDKKRNLLNPNLRLFVDVGGPGRVQEPKEKISLANALEQILKGAEVDGISVNVTNHSSFDESLAWAKELINLVRFKVRKNLTIAVDIGRSGNKVGEGCNVPGASLDTQLPTLNHPDPRVELTMIIKNPSQSDGDNEGCHRGGPAGTFDLSVFLDYLRNTTRKHTYTGN